MIRGIHGLLYSSQADEARAFLRDKLRLPFSDVGEGWLIFDLPEGDLGVHPIDESGRPPAGTHDVSLYCDDIEGTVTDLRSRGVPFKGGIEDHGYGLVTYFTMPGGLSVQLYEPRYVKRTGRGGRTRPASRTRPAGRTPPAGRARRAKPAAKKAAARRPRTAAKAKAGREGRGKRRP